MRQLFKSNKYIFKKSIHTYIYISIIIYASINYLQLVVLQKQFKLNLTRYVMVLNVSFYYSTSIIITSYGLILHISSV